MKKTAPITKVLTTNCTIVEAMADIQTIREIFDHFPNRFLPVVKGLEFVGVILRDDFFMRFLTSQDYNLSAKDLISKEMVKLSADNTIEEAKEIFDTKVFDVLPVTDEDGDLMGVLLRNEVEAAYNASANKGLLGIGNRMRRVMSFL
ncbi:MAG: CBS domain-containing protein [Saprospiraceae bacterium]